MDTYLRFAFRVVDICSSTVNLIALCWKIPTSLKYVFETFVVKGARNFKAETNISYTSIF